MLQQATLGLGEAYMDGWWDCEAIDQFIDRALRADLEDKIKRNWRLLLHVLRSRLLNLQSPAMAFEVGEQHYDLGNDLYQAMLDKRLNYTCGYWQDATTLDEAQEAKLELVCKKIGLQPGMRVLELGCGWGSFAKYAAEKYGAEVLGVTVSKEQVALGMELCQGLPVELRLQDYREVEGTYDAVISIGVMEHVGYKNYRTYMQVVDRCLKAGRHRLCAHHRRQQERDHQRPLDQQVHLSQRHAALHRPARRGDGRAVCHGGLAQFWAAL